MFTFTSVHIFEHKTDLIYIRDYHIRFLQDFFGKSNITHNKSRISTEYASVQYNRLYNRYFVFKNNERLMENVRGYGINKIFFYDVDRKNINEDMFPLFFGNIGTCKYEFISLK